MMSAATPAAVGEAMLVPETNHQLLPTCSLTPAKLVLRVAVMPDSSPSVSMFGTSPAWVRSIPHWGLKVYAKNAPKPG